LNPEYGSSRGLSRSLQAAIRRPHEKEGQREIRGVIIAPDVQRCFGHPFTLPLEDGRTLDLLVTGADGAGRGDRDFYDIRGGEAPGYDVRRRLTVSSTWRIPGPR
jgi:hypothetical protein